MKRIHTCVYCLVVHLDNRITLLAVGLLCCFLHVLYCLLYRHDIRKSEKCRLKNCVCSLTHTNLNSLVDGVDCVESDIVLCYILLCSGRHMLIKLFIRPLAVDEENSARLYVLNHLISLGNV